jgi:hypothetical protein
VVMEVDPALPRSVLCVGRRAIHSFVHVDAIMFTLIIASLAA